MPFIWPKSSLERRLQAAARIAKGGHLALEPAWQLAGRWQVNDRGGRNGWESANLIECLVRRLAVEVEHADCFAARRGPADCHLGDIDAVFAENRTYAPDDAGHVPVTEDEQTAVQIGLETEIVERDEPRHLLAKERAGGPVLGGVG